MIKPFNQKKNMLGREVPNPGKILDNERLRPGVPIAYATTQSMPIASTNGLPAAYGAPGPNAPRTAEPDTGARAQQFADVLRGVAKLNEICDSMQKDLIEAKSTLVKLGVRTRDADQDLISAAYALCEFRDRVLEKRADSASGTDAAGAPALDSSASDTPAAGATVGGKTARGKPRCHVGRKVAVLWVPEKFPRNSTPELSDLVPYRGVVVKHIRLRKGGTHLVHYEDGMYRWHKQDRLFKFL